MLRISKLADYGTIVMVHFAMRPNELCTARDVALRTHLTIPTVSKLLKQLTAAGLLTSIRGVAGGYQLQRPAADITVAQIIYAVEISRGLTECSLQPNECSLQAVCPIQGNWQLISQVIEKALDSVSLDMLAKPLLERQDIDRIRRLASGVRHDKIK